MKYLISLLFPLLILSACGGGSGEQDGTHMVDSLDTDIEYTDPTTSPAEDDGSDETADWALETFTDWPDEVWDNGCSCYFSKNAEDRENQVYIYMDLYSANISYLKINGEMVRIDRDKPAENDYNIEIEYDSDESSEDEVWTKTGTISVTAKDGTSQQLSFIGECGC